VIEFTVRFGDQDAQVVIPMCEGSLARCLASAAEGALEEPGITFNSKKHIGVVIASAGYPGVVRSDVPIEGLSAAEAEEDVLVFHAGTKEKDGVLVTAGGRVLTIVGRGKSYQEAIDRAYTAVGRISFEGMQYRRDIGKKAL
jgi:phosphoribosylamine--glycine ligase